MKTIKKHQNFEFCFIFYIYCILCLVYCIPVFHSVKVKSSGVIWRHKLCPDVVFWMTVIYTQIFNPGCKTFIEPKVSPPFLQELLYIRVCSHKPSTRECAHMGSQLGSWYDVTKDDITWLTMSHNGWHKRSNGTCY